MYVIFWQYKVRADCVSEFEVEYGPEGAWGDFFRKGKGYRRTALFRESGDPACFLTIDYWDSEEDFRRFESAHLVEYGTLDRRFEQFTEKETRLGAMTLAEEG